MFEKETSYKSLASVHKIFFYMLMINCMSVSHVNIAQETASLQLFWGTTDQGQFSHWRDHIAAPIYVVIYYTIKYDIAVNMMPL